MIGNQIGVARRLDPMKVEKIAELIYTSECVAYAKMNKPKKAWHEISNHDRNLYKDQAEHFLKFNYKWF